MTEISELIHRRRRQILVHSSIYYRMDTQLVDDYTFDKWSKELAELQKNYPEVADSLPYAKEFKEYDGSTGFDLPYHNPEITNVAVRLLNQHKK